RDRNVTGVQTCALPIYFKYDLHTVSLPLFILKLVFFIAIINIFTYVLALYAGIPYVLIVLVALIIGYSIFMNKTVFGRHIYAVEIGRASCRERLVVLVL